MLVHWNNNQWECSLVYFKCTWNGHHAGQICTVWIFFFSESMNSWFHSIISVYSNVTSSHQTLKLEEWTLGHWLSSDLHFLVLGELASGQTVGRGENITEGRSRNNSNFYFILCYFIDIRPAKTEKFRLDCTAVVLY